MLDGDDELLAGTAVPSDAADVPFPPGSREGDDIVARCQALSSFGYLASLKLRGTHFVHIVSSLGVFKDYNKKNYELG